MTPIDYFFMSLAFSGIFQLAICLNDCSLDLNSMPPNNFPPLVIDANNKIVNPIMVDGRRVITLMNNQKVKVS